MKRAVWALLILVAVSGFYLLIPLLPKDLAQLREVLPEWRNFQTQFPILSMALFAIVYILVTAFSIPGAALLTLAGGAMFGLWWGVAVVSFASTAGATASFLLVRWMFRETVNRRFTDALRSVNQGFQKDGAIYILFLRLVPAFPFFLVNLLLALTSVKLWVYVVASQIGMLPATFIYVAAGSELSRLDSLSDVLSVRGFTVLLALGVFPLLIRFMASLFFQRRLYRKWNRPKSFDYDLVILGGGSAGLVSAQVGTTVGAKVALIESHRMGGDCLNTGCVPSKTLIRISKEVAAARKGASWWKGSFPSSDLDFAAIKREVGRVIRVIEPHDSMDRYRSLGVDCIKGKGIVSSPFEVRVGERRISSRNLIIASGAQPRVPLIEGLAGAPYCTSDTLWDLENLPKRMVILGGGAIGCELGQALQRLGTEVTIVDRSTRPLAREEGEAAQLIRGVLEEEGVTFLSDAAVDKIERQGSQWTLKVNVKRSSQSLPFDQLFLAVGREPRIHGIGLEELGIISEGRIEVNEFLATKYSNIFACGDVVGPLQFTHAAAHQAWHASVNALARPWKRFAVDYRYLPWVTFTDPEIGRIGLTLEETVEKSMEVESFFFPLSRSDRAQTEGNTRGFVKVVTLKGSDRIVGATIVGPRAGEMIAEVALAMRNGLGMTSILRTIHAYPTYSEALRFVAADWKRKNAPLWLIPYVRNYFSWQRGRAK